MKLYGTERRQLVESIRRELNIPADIPLRERMDIAKAYAESHPTIRARVVADAAGLNPVTLHNHRFISRHSTRERRLFLQFIKLTHPDKAIPLAIGTVYEELMHILHSLRGKALRKILIASGYSIDAASEGQAAPSTAVTAVP